MITKRHHRTGIICRMNYNVIRFSNEEVLHDIDNVIDKISGELQCYE